MAQRGGTIIIPSDINSLNAAKPSVFSELLEWVSDDGLPHAVEMQLQTQALDPTVSGSDFPDVNYVRARAAGATGWTYDFDGNSCTVMQVETGAGSNARRFWCDLRAGRFSLGVQTRVRLSVCRWVGNATSGESLTVQGSIAPAQAVEADPPTYTMRRMIDSGLTEDAPIPPGAHWFYVNAQGNPDADQEAECQLRIVSEDADTFIVDTTQVAPLHYPPASPWPVPIGSTFLRVHNVGTEDAVVSVIYWVR
jgi:hypothetical protein